MSHVEKVDAGALVPYFALCLFAGIRPCPVWGEMSRLRAEHIRLDIGVIHIEPEVSKVRRKRLVTIQPNLAVWLQAYPLDRFPIRPKDVRRIRRKVFDEFELPHDVLVERGGNVVTDGLGSYAGLRDHGFNHVVSRHTPEIGLNLLPKAHRVASLLKRWILGTHQGSIGKEHLQQYLDEFVFRFNRRTSRSRGLLFYRLMQQAIAHPPMPKSHF